MLWSKQQPWPDFNQYRELGGLGSPWPTLGVLPSSRKVWEEAAESKMLAQAKEACVGHRKTFDATETDGTLEAGRDQRERGSENAMPRQREPARATEPSMD